MKEETAKTLTDELYYLYSQERWPHVPQRVLAGSHYRSLRLAFEGGPEPTSSLAPWQRSEGMVSALLIGASLLFEVRVDLPADGASSPRSTWSHGAWMPSLPPSRSGSNPSATRTRSEGGCSRFRSGHALISKRSTQLTCPDWIDGSGSRER
jgi:hypothetical protein